jgi:hypothetical protein
MSLAHFFSNPKCRRKGKGNARIFLLQQNKNVFYKASGIEAGRAF